jgi:uncharacterized membrane protein
MKTWIEANRSLALAYCLFALVALVIVLLRLPAMMGADEPNHLRRANLLAEGNVVGRRVQVGQVLTSGGPEENTLVPVEQIYSPMEFHPEVKLSQVDVAKGASIKWGQNTSDQSFENTAIYPPFFYLPSGISILIGKLMGLTIVQTLSLARAGGALACIAVGFFALRLAGQSAAYLFTLLLLPMALVLGDTVTQDGLLLATSALASGLMTRSVMDQRSMTNAELWGAAICLALIGMAKPPYVLLSLLLLTTNVEKPGLKRVATVVALIGGLAWHALMAVLAQTPMRRDGVQLDSGAQIAFLLHHPAAIASVAFQTLRHGGAEFVAQFVGELGWLDTPLPKLYYLAALVALVVSAVLIWSVDWKAEKRRSLSSLIILGATKLAIFAALYIAYTPVGAMQVEGVQGRYFLPVAAFFPLALVGSRTIEPSRMHKIVLGFLVAFPLVTLPVLYRTLALRYG